MSQKVSRSEKIENHKRSSQLKGGKLNDIFSTLKNHKLTSLQQALGNQRTHRFLQAKLKINQPGDKYEQEADRAAEQIISGKNVSTSNLSIPQVQRMCSECEEEVQRQPMEDQEQIQKKEIHSADSSNQQPADELAGVVRSGGQELPKSVRAYFEPYFGNDFSDVRIHTDVSAAESARAIRARAYTVGRNITFASGEYSPETTAGRRLLAHELTHTIQQTGRGMTGNRKQTSIVQRQFSDPGEPPPPPDFECSIDPVMATRAAAGDREAALRVIRCCVSDIPVVGRGCTDELVEAVCKLFPDVCEKKKKEPKPPKCPVGFRPGRSEANKGKCCPSGKDTELFQECCAPGQMIKNLGISSCCRPPAVPNQDRTKCIVPKLEPCPPDRKVPLFKPDVFVPRVGCICMPESRQNLKEGVCCPVGEDGSSGTCVTKKEKPPPPPPQPKPPSINIVKTFVLGFEKDAPQTWFDPRASFKASLTDDGETEFAILVEELNSNPEEQVQLEGRASSDRPVNDPEYNNRLTDRRVKLIATELSRQKIDTATRVADPPGQGTPSGCSPITLGQWSCGDNGAKKPADKDDRKVIARVFTVTQSP